MEDISDLAIYNIFKLFHFHPKCIKGGMNVKKTSLFLIALMLIISAFAGCQRAAEPVESPVITESITEVPDSETVVEEPTEELLQIVSTVPSVTEILFALGCGDQIIGVDSFSNYPEAALAIEKVGDYNGFDVEKIISLEPTIVFAGNKLQQEEIDTLIGLGINVLETEPTGFEDITSSILEIGAAVQKDIEAQELVDSINSSIDKIVNNVDPAADKPTIYYVMGIGEYGNWTSGEGSFINTAMELVGAECITNGPDMAPWMDYPLEDLIIADPDILMISMYVTEESLLADPTYMELTAVKEGNYFFINPDIIERPGPRIVEALEFMQDCLLEEYAEAA